MFDVRPLSDPQLKGAIELIGAEGKARAVVVPGRGAIVTELELGGRKVLYLDRATLLDASANVRGGIPILFPSPGKLADDTWKWTKFQGAMKQHGFARNMAWNVVGKSGDNQAARLSLELSSNDATLRQFPWAFRFGLTIELRADELVLQCDIDNLDKTRMPCGLGFHPYFDIKEAEKAKLQIPTKATRAFDNVTKREGAFTGFDFTKEEVDAHLLDHRYTFAEMRLPDRTLTVRGTGEFSHWVVWAKKGKDFVCVEPWTCPGDALNTHDLRLMLIDPGQRQSARVVFSLKSS